MWNSQCRKALSRKVILEIGQTEQDKPSLQLHLLRRCVLIPGDHSSREPQAFLDPPASLRILAFSQSLQIFRGACLSPWICPFECCAIGSCCLIVKSSSRTWALERYLCTGTTKVVVDGVLHFSNISVTWINWAPPQNLWLFTSPLRGLTALHPKHCSCLISFTLFRHPRVHYSRADQSKRVQSNIKKQPQPDKRKPRAVVT